MLSSREPVRTTLLMLGNTSRLALRVPCDIVKFGVTPAWGLWSTVVVDLLSAFVVAYKDFEHGDVLAGSKEAMYALNVRQVLLAANGLWGA